ncbi:MAG: hypothetical protein LQ346_006260 [Caloplaca aetnensis]|nr:MAG: hypothetical protein LQ346_006260 [Caloplaca aetnensis]
MAWCSTDFGYTFAQSAKPDNIVPVSQVPWTAARCQRLLRPLSAKIALLRKEKQLINVKQESQPSQGAPTSSDIRRPALSFGERRRKSDTVNLANEEWAPTPRPSKRIKRTYSSRNPRSQYRNDPSQSTASDPPTNGRPGIIIPSDFLGANAQIDGEAGAGASSQSLERHQSAEECQSRPHIQRSEELSGKSSHGRSRCLYSCTVSFERKLTGGIYKGVDALLKATERQEASQRGPRRLFASCLRKVPDYITQEEQWNEAEDPESNIDISSAVYNDLESLSTSQVNGWDPLRQVVRSHGISMVGSAISEGLIESNSFCDLVSLCLRLGAYDEAQHLLDCMIMSLEPLQKYSAIRSTLKVLEEFVHATGRHGFRYRVLAKVSASRGLSPDWISRPETVDTWNKVVQSISQQDEHAGPAADLLRLAIIGTYGLACQDPAEFVHAVRLRQSGHLKRANVDVAESENHISWPRDSRTAAINGDYYNGKASATISSLMTVLCAIGLLRSAATTSGPGELYMANMNALQGIATDAQQVLKLASEGMFVVRGEIVAIPLLAAGLVQATLCRNRHEFANSIPGLFDNLAGIDQDDSVIEGCSSFLCAVAECCARGMCEEAFDHTQKVVKHILHIAKSLKPVAISYRLCNRIGVAAALEYAETAHHPKHLHWALEVEQAVTGAQLDPVRRTPAKTPSRGQTQTQNGYRWEAGICEWVAKTPAIALRKPRMLVQPASSALSADRISGSACERSKACSLSPSSPSSGEASNKAQDSHRIPTRRSSRGSRSLGSAASNKPDEGRASQMFFSHVWVDGEGDELSTAESSQETQGLECGLGAGTNVAARLNQRPAVRKRTSETHKRRGTRCTSPRLVQVHQTENRMPVQDIALESDSEDELSFL